MPLQLPDAPIAALLPTRGSWMIDVVFLATFAIVVALAYSIFLVRVKRRHRAHARLQMVLCAVLVVAITAFEIDLRFFSDWRALARPSPYYASGWVDRWLAVHLIFAVPTPLLWLATLFLGVRWFGWDATPNRHGVRHRRLGWVSAAAMAMTTLTAWVFYWVAFAAA